MNDEELHAMIRESIARHLGRAETAPLPASPRGQFEPHVSQGMFPLARGSDDEGACLIEPAVRCTHCGYCVSYGH
jgi:hypothetical protein